MVPHPDARQRHWGDQPQRINGSGLRERRPSRHSHPPVDELAKGELLIQQP